MRDVARQIAWAKGQRGAPSRMTRGSWLADLAALKKAIVLCPSCEHKWNPKAYGYHSSPLWPGQHYVTGDCDACGIMGSDRKLFTVQE